MIGRSTILMFGLWLSCMLMSDRASAQEPTAQATPPAATAWTDWRAEGTQGAVSAGGRDAVLAGLEILKQGGNAADSAAATIFALSVTDWRSFCFGGEVPILIYDAKRQGVTVIAGQGTAPRLATLDHFKGSGSIPNRGIEPAAVPAALDACLTLLDRFGTMTFAQTIAPTQALLRRPARPAPWFADFARTLELLVEAEGSNHPLGGSTSAPNDRSRGLRLVADAFYRGPIARRIDTWSSAHGGLIRYADLATYTTRIEEPVAIQYHGRTIYKCGAWTQGPYLLEALQILEGIDVKAMGHNSPNAVHTIVETMKLALADRDTYYADPLFADVPLAALLSPDYANLRRGLINPERASLARRPGDPRHGKAILDPAADPAQRHMPPPGPVHDTTTCLVADRFGNVVAATPSGWSGVVAGDTGVWLGSRLQSFNVWSDHPNVIEPGKRPRVTLSPTLVLRDDKPELAISVAGGDNQDQMILQLLLNHLEFGLDPATSVTAPRFMTDHLINSFRQSAPALGKLRINSEFGATTLEALKARGHILSISSGPLAAAPSIIAIEPKTGKLRAAGDPRAGRHAMGF
jgi:gamma-glutamyltranspeptidase/glutathione hydrolase